MSTHLFAHGACLPTAEKNFWYESRFSLVDVSFYSPHSHEQKTRKKYEKPGHSFRVYHHLLFTFLRFRSRCGAVESFLDLLLRESSYF